MIIDERLENISQQLEILTGMQHANERRFEEIARESKRVTANFEIVHDSIKSLERVAEIHEHRSRI